MTVCHEEPTPEQLAALRAYAKQKGRYWKSKLRLAWLYSNYNGFPQSAELQQVRNRLGPSWLTHFQL
jgi:hypothetical protein